MLFASNPPSHNPAKSNNNKSYTNRFSPPTQTHNKTNLTQSRIRNEIGRRQKVFKPFPFRRSRLYLLIFLKIIFKRRKRKIRGTFRLKSFKKSVSFDTSMAAQPPATVPESSSSSCSYQHFSRICEQNRGRERERERERERNVSDRREKKEW